VKDWLKAASHSSVRWNVGDDVIGASSRRTDSLVKPAVASSKDSTGSKTKRARRDYDEFDEEYDRGRIAKHKRRVKDKAPSLPKPGRRGTNPFQKR
jgi:hypothetical protein